MLIIAINTLAAVLVLGEVYSSTEFALFLRLFHALGRNRDFPKLLVFKSNGVQARQEA